MPKREGESKQKQEEQLPEERQKALKEYFDYLAIDQLEDMLKNPKFFESRKPFSGDLSYDPTDDECREIIEKIITERKEKE